MPFQTPPRWRDVVSGIVFWGAVLAGLILIGWVSWILGAVGALS